jgi:hypothetical protein
MRRSLIIAPLLVLPFLSSISCAGDVQANAKPKFPGPLKAFSVPKPKAENLNQGQPESCAMMDIATDPRVLATAMLAGLNPKTYLAFLQRLTNPEALRQYLGASTPQSAMDEVYSATDPEYQTALLSRATESKITSNWQQAMRDPAYLQSGVYVSNNPVTWVNVTADGRQFGSMLNWFNPKAYIGWMRLAAVPKPRGSAGAKEGFQESASLPLIFSTPPQRY